MSKTKKGIKVAALVSLTIVGFAVLCHMRNSGVISEYIDPPAPQSLLTLRTLFNFQVNSIFNFMLPNSINSPSAHPVGDPHHRPARAGTRARGRANQP